MGSRFLDGIWRGLERPVSLLVLLLVAKLSQAADQPQGAATASKAPLIGSESPADILAQGRELARLHCQGCHLQPEPDQLDKATWYEQTLPRMSIRLGFMPQSIDRHPEADLLKASGRFATTPYIPLSDWKAITNFYVSSAPEKPLPQVRSQPIRVGLKSFRVEPAAATESGGRRRPSSALIPRTGVCLSAMDGARPWSCGGQTDPCAKHKRSAMCRWVFPSDRAWAFWHPLAVSCRPTGLWQMSGVGTAPWDHWAPPHPS